jgi:hypothetical protein
MDQNQIFLQSIDNPLSASPQSVIFAYVFGYGTICYQSVQGLIYISVELTAAIIR